MSANLRSAYLNPTRTRYSSGVQPQRGPPLLHTFPWGWSNREGETSESARINKSAPDASDHGLNRLIGQCEVQRVASLAECLREEPSMSKHRVAARGHGIGCVHDAAGTRTVLQRAHVGGERAYSSDPR
jgi:hypothetical protein